MAVYSEVCTTCHCLYLSVEPLKEFVYDTAPASAMWQIREAAKALAGVRTVLEAHLASCH